MVGQPNQAVDGASVVALGQVCSRAAMQALSQASLFPRLALLLELPPLPLPLASPS